MESEKDLVILDKVNAPASPPSTPDGGKRGIVKCPPAPKKRRRLTSPQKTVMSVTLMAPANSLKMEVKIQSTDRAWTLPENWEPLIARLLNLSIPPNLTYLYVSPKLLQEFYVNEEVVQNDGSLLVDCSADQ
jgi:hypothetical protein